MKRMALAALIALAAGGASAQVYVGGAAGISQFSVDCTGADTCDKSDTAFKIYGGYQFAPAWSAEVGYIDFGGYKASGWVYLPGYGNYYAQGKVKSAAVTLSVAGRAAFTPALSGVARLGVADVDTQSDVTLNYAATGSDSQTAIKPYLGLGLEYAFTKKVHGLLNADFTQAEINGSSGSIRAFTVGVQYDF